MKEDEQNMEENYNNILTGLEYFESLLKQLESENKNCENIDVILNSQIAGIVQERIKRDIETKTLIGYEREDLENRFDELKDYFADIQVEFEQGCKCKVSTAKEQNEIYERHEKRTIERHGVDYLKKAIATAMLQLTEEQVRERGR